MNSSNNTSASAIQEGRTFYVAPNGNDDNTGTIDSPFATITKAHEAVQAGDTIYLRGGTYKPPKDQTTRLTKSGTESQPIRLFAYENEQPILDGSDWTRQPNAEDNKSIIRQSGDYWHVKGIEIASSPRHAYKGESVKGSTYEDLTLHGNELVGLELAGDGTENNTILGGDFYNNFDPLANGNSGDGIKIIFGSGEGNRVDGARLYNNSDDGIDLFGFDDAVTIENSWAYGNGVDRWNVGEAFRGDGNGFKLSGSSAADLSDLKHIVRNNAAWNNTLKGFDYNKSQGNMEITNNTSYNNGLYGYEFFLGTHRLRNNIALDDEVLIRDRVDDANNSWTLGVTADSNDFLSLDASKAEGARQANGDLPETDFLKLRSDSDLIDAGVDLGLPFEGQAPDLGAFETNAASAPPTPPTPPNNSDPEKLIASYSFDDTEGNVVTDSSEEGEDNSAQRFGASYQEGPRGRHLRLGGNDLAKIANTQDINLGIQKQRTVSLRFKVDNKSVDSRKQVLYEEGAGFRGLNAYVYDDKLFVGGWNEPTRESGWDGTWLNTSDIQNDTWHRLTLVIDGDVTTQSDAMTAYLDGEAFGTGEASQLWSHSGGIGLGGVNGGTKFHDGLKPGGGNGLAGALDEVRIFNSALTGEQVQNITA